MWKKLPEVALRALLSIAILAGAFFGVQQLGSKGRPGKTERAKPRPKVEVMAATAHEGEFDFEVDGVVIPFREVSIAAEVGGRVAYKSPNCEAGRSVRTGDLLFRIDPQEYQLEIERLKEEVSSAEGNVEELGVEVESAIVQVQLADEEVTIRRRELARFEKAPDPVGLLTSGN